MAGELDYTFHAMGSDVRLLIGRPLLPSAPPPRGGRSRARVRVGVRAPALAVSPDSDLSALNRDPRSRGRRLRSAACSGERGLWAAERSGGLVDPTLVRALERSGYDHSLDGAIPAPLQEALAHAPPRRAARPHPAGAVASDRGR